MLMKPNVYCVFDNLQAHTFVFPVYGRCCNGHFNGKYSLLKLELDTPFKIFLNKLFLKHSVRLLDKPNEFK